jgi:hyperosmotically inducible protein
MGVALLGLVLGMAMTVSAASSDAWITTKTKMSLLTTADVPATNINVDTVDGRVTLHGKVSTADEKSKAETVARGVEGVRDVRNLLQVVPTTQRNDVKANDSELKQKVGEVLEKDARLGESKIAVQSVNDGVVLLSGTAKTLTDQLHAIEVASRVPGVRRVASEVKGPDRLSDRELWNESKTPEHTAAGSTAGDLWITSATKLRLLADGRTPALDINVDTNAGVVTLFGMVDAAEAKQAAEEDARKVTGVKRVANEIQVVAKTRQAAVKASDEDVESDVKRALESHEDLRRARIGVEVKNGVARLSGTVPSQEQRITAAVTARTAQGVRSVEDDLEVGNSVD